MSEAISHDGQESELDASPLLIEGRRQMELNEKRLSTVLSDAELIKLLTVARRSVENGTDLSASSIVRIDQHDFEFGETTVEIPRRVILILAELFHSVRDVLADRWTADYPDGPKLFHESELPDAALVDQLLPENITQEGPLPDHRIQEYLGVALALEKDDLAFEIEHSHEPDPDVLQGSLHISAPATDAPKVVLEGVQNRLQRIFDTPPVHISRFMKEWRQWKGHIETATPEDTADLHGLYRGVLIPTERLICMDPRFASPEEFAEIAHNIRGHGTMFKSLRDGNGGDEIQEGLNYGRIAIVRDERQDDAPDMQGELLGFYNVLGNPDIVRDYMRRELHFNRDRKYDSADQLPVFTGLQEDSGEVRSVTYRDLQGALQIFRAAAEGRLAWSVDHAVRMNGPSKLQRYAQLGTALKLDEYDFLEREEGKTDVLMKIATAIGADASKAAKQQGLQAVDTSQWEQKGRCPWYVDNSGMVVLPRPIANVGSRVLNERLGAHEVLTVTEEFERDGVRIRILWSYLAQHLPADIPS